jgi:CBS domain-containing protein
MLTYDVHRVLVRSRDGRLEGVITTLDIAKWLRNSLGRK